MYFLFWKPTVVKFVALMYDQNVHWVLGGTHAVQLALTLNEGFREVILLY